MNTLLQFVLITTFVVQPVTLVQTPVAILDGTPVRIRINQTISSADAKVGQTVDFEILDWDLVVIDEAHRLRNVYKPNNKISHAIKQAVAPYQKALLTATPLQNSLLELYGLVSIIDEFTFGDLKSFRAQYARLTGDADFAELKQRLQPVCKRTLRKQVLEYIKYTNRHALVEEFILSTEG